MFGFRQEEKNQALVNALEHYSFSEERLKKALKRGADPNFTNYRFPGPLFAAVALYYDTSVRKAVDVLLEAGADVNKTEESTGRNVLHYMIGHDKGDMTVFRRLVEAGADVRLSDKDGNTPLMAAIEKKMWAQAEFLLEQGGNVLNSAEQGYRQLAIAFVSGAPLGIIKRLFEQPVNVNFAPDAPPLLHLAVQAGREYADFLLAQPDILLDQPDKEGYTALMKAVLKGDRDTVAALLTAKASPGMAGKDGVSPLVLAAQNGYQAIVELLIASGAPLDAAGRGVTALTHAADRGDIRMVMTLLAAAEKKDEKLGFIPGLYAAAGKGHGRVLELLIEAGADVNTAGKDGRTPLMRAALADQVEAIAILVKAGAKPDAADNHGMRAYDHAVSAGRAKAKEALARYRPETARAESAVAHLDDYAFMPLNSHSLEVREGDSLAMTFNFWTQQVIIRDTSRPASAPVVQNFADVQRQEAIAEAWEKLKELGGTPPDPRIASVQKKQAPGLGRL